jgi:hypothetical protein
MGATIIHLSVALSPIPITEIRTEVVTGTVEVQDETIPDDENNVTIH